MPSLANEKLSQTKFNYEELKPEQRSVVQQRAVEIRSCLQRSAEDVWQIGHKLVEVRSWLKYGQFDTWLKVEFDWSRRTAYNFINVYETFHQHKNLANINIATSALYLLAAPSTSQDIRDEFLQQSRGGKRVAFKDLRNAIRESKQALSASTPTKSSTPPTSRPRVVKLISKGKVNVNPSVAEVQRLQSRFAFPDVTFNQSAQPIWRIIENRHMIFYGDTASPQFTKYIPHAAFALAIPTTEWQHDWIIEKARVVVSIAQELVLEERLIEQLLSVFSKPGEVVIFPWLPNEMMLKIAHELGRKIFAGDPNPEKCEEGIKQLGLRSEIVECLCTVADES